MYIKVFKVKVKKKIPLQPGGAKGFAFKLRDCAWGWYE
jgi:hypothetical protein